MWDRPHSPLPGKAARPASPHLPPPTHQPICVPLKILASAHPVLILFPLLLPLVLSVCREGKGQDALAQGQHSHAHGRGGSGLPPVTCVPESAWGRGLAPSRVSGHFSGPRSPGLGEPLRICDCQDRRPHTAPSIPLCSKLWAGNRSEEEISKTRAREGAE